MELRPKAQEVEETRPSMFLTTLKQSTAKQHIQLESQSLLASIMKDEVTVSQYGMYLYIMKAIEQAYEKEVLPKVQFIFSRINTPSSQLITADLEKIAGFSSVKTDLPEFSLPVKISIPFALGFMYVMEGSKLGGRVIFRHIQKSLGFTEQSGAGFLANLGGNTGADWKQFLLELTNYVDRHGVEDEVISGARYAFQSIHDYYEFNTAAR